MRRFPLKRFLLVAILVTLAVTSLAIQEIRVSAGGVNFVRGSDSILGLRLGLDLEGGSHLVYEALPADGSESPTSDQMEGVIQTIERRVNAFGVAEPIIQSMGAIGFWCSFRVWAQPRPGSPSIKTWGRRSCAPFWSIWDAPTFSLSGKTTAPM